MYSPYTVKCQDILENEYTRFLKGIPIFKNLSDHFIYVLSTRAKKVHYKKGKYIFHETDEAKAIYFVKRGIIKVKKTNPLGKELIVCIKQTGDILAESSLFCEPGALYHETAQALLDSEVIVITNSDLEDVMAVNPTSSIEMIRFMGEQLHSFTSQLIDLTLLDVYSKTLKTLERLAREFGCKTNNEVIIEIPLSIQELANIIGATRESVSRVFAKLREQDVVTINNKSISINSWNTFYQKLVDTYQCGPRFHLEDTKNRL